MNTIKQFLGKTFSQPEGFWGTLAGRVMYIKNRERIDWTISLLSFKQGEAVLEIGFGPGYSIERLLEVPAGLRIAGVDIAATMVDQAFRRLRRIGGEAVDLRIATAEQLPFASASFDKVITINSMFHWRDQVKGLNEVRRVLKPGGEFVMTEQNPYSANIETRSRRMKDIYQLLRDGGFNGIEHFSKEAEPNPFNCFTGRKD